MQIEINQETYDNYLIQIDNLLINLGRVEESMNYLKVTNFNKEEYDELDNLRRDIKQRIKEKKEIINNAIIVEKNESNIVELNNVIRIKTYFSENVFGIETFELTLDETDFDSEIQKISIKSPMGKALFESKVGDTVYYTVNNNINKVEILEKVNVNKLMKG